MKRDPMKWVTVIGVIVVGLIGITVYFVNKDSKPKIDSGETPIENTATVDSIDNVVAEYNEPEIQPTPPVKVFEGTTVSLEGVFNEAFTAYDNKVLSGTQVKEALQLFSDKRVAFLVATQMVIDGTVALNILDGNVSEATPTVGVSGITGIINTLGEDVSDKLTFTNYNAVLKCTKGKAVMVFETDHFVAKDGLDISDDMCLVNTAMEKTAMDGFSENIADYLQMQSYLVKDSEGEVIGIAFYSI